jgi:SAM-dependent methyltransferase
MVRRILARLRGGIGIPFIGVRVAIDVSKVRAGAAATAMAADIPDTGHKITVHHIDTLVHRCPALGRFRHSSVATNRDDAAAFFEFCNDAVALFEDRAREVQLRRLLVRLRDGLASPQFRDQVTRRIAESDLNSGVIDRALILKDDPDFAERVAVEVAEYDRNYGVPTGFLATVLSGLSLEGDARGRTLKWVFSRNEALLRGRRILHVAPEDALRAFFIERGAELGCTYETLDGFSMDTSHRADLCQLPFANGSYDLVICHRVLEHVLDDSGALAEIHRILSPGGVLSVSVPQAMNQATTNEWLACDASHHFHVRQYGRDFEDRLKTAGFGVTVERSTLELPLECHSAARTFPLRHYFCRKLDRQRMHV